MIPGLHRYQLQIEQMDHSSDLRAGSAAPRSEHEYFRAAESPESLHQDYTMNLMQAEGEQDVSISIIFLWKVYAHKIYV